MEDSNASSSDIPHAESIDSRKKQYKEGAIRALFHMGVFRNPRNISTMNAGIREYKDIFLNTPNESNTLAIEVALYVCDTLIAATEKLKIKEEPIPAKRRGSNP
jgi:hypothetical protein